MVVIIIEAPGLAAIFLIFRIEAPADPKFLEPGCERTAVTVQ